MSTNGILVKFGDGYEIVVDVDIDDTPIIEYTAPEEISKDWTDDPEICESHDFEKKPEETDGKGEIKLVKDVKTLPIEAFKQTNIKTIKLPVLTKISKSMFEECTSLTKIDIPKEVKVIEQNAFKKCTSLAKVVLNDGLQTIEESSFEGCTELNDINIPSTIEEVGNNAFAGDNEIPTEVAEEIDEINNTSFGISLWETNGCLVSATTDSTTFINPGQTLNFYDSGGPSGRHAKHLNIKHTIKSPEGTYIHTHFSSINLGSSATLALYDSSTTDVNERIGQWAGNQVPSDCTTSANVCTFVFKSYNIQANGWVAEITADNVPPTSTNSITVTPKTEALSVIEGFENIVDTQENENSTIYYINRNSSLTFLISIDPEQTALINGYTYSDGDVFQITNIKYDRTLNVEVLDPEDPEDPENPEGL
jgi:hypothetical protein